MSDSALLGIPYAKDGRDWSGLDCRGAYIARMGERGIVVQDPGDVVSPPTGFVLVTDGTERAGDLLIFDRKGVDGHCGHDEGDGYVLHSSRTGGVQLSRLDRMRPLLRSRWRWQP